MTNGLSSETQTDKVHECSAPGGSARQVAGLFGTRVTVLCMGIVSGVFVTRSLGPTNRGLLAFIYVLLAYASTLSFGFGAGVRYLVTSREYRPQDIAVTALIIGCFQGVGAALVIYFLWRHDALGSVGHELSPHLIVPMILCLPLVFVANMANRVLVGDSRFLFSNSLELGRQGTLAVLLMVAVVGLGLGIRGAVGVLVGVQSVAALAAAALLVLLYRPPLRIRLDAVRRSFSYGLKGWLGGLASQANRRLDQFLLGLFAPAASLGLYAVAVRLAELPLMLIDVSVPVLFNRIAGLGTPERQARLVEQLHRAYLVVICVVCAMIGIGSPALVPAVYGTRFAGAIIPLLLYLPGILFQVSWRTVGPYFLATNRPLTSTMIQGFGLLVAAPCYLLLIPRWGVAGAAAASSLTYLACAVGALWSYGRANDFRAAAFFRPRVSDLSWIWQQLVSVARGKTAPSEVCTK